MPRSVHGTRLKQNCEPPHQHQRQRIGVNHHPPSTPRSGPTQEPSPTTCFEQMSPQRSQHPERTYTKPHYPLARIPRPPTADVGTKHTLIPPGQPTSRNPGNRRHRLTTPPLRDHISANQRHEGRELHPHETSQTTDQAPQIQDHRT